MKKPVITIRKAMQSLCRTALSGLCLTWLVLISSPTVQAQGICPAITNTALTSVTITTGQLVDSLAVTTKATSPDNIEFVRFDTLYTNPYQGKNGVHLGEITPANGMAVQRNVSFPPNTGTTDKIYYVYGCLKPVPTDPNCIPFALITVTIKPEPGCPPAKCLPITVKRIKSGRGPL